ncbi:MAG: hypothetical protein ACYCO3_16630 [Mycobacteriales bacterium]
MAEVRAEAERSIDAPAGRVHTMLTDYSARAGWLPEEYSEVRVEADGSYAYRLSVGGRVRDYRRSPRKARWSATTARPL